MVFSIKVQFGNHEEIGSNFLKDVAFCLNQTKNGYLCLTQCISKKLYKIAGSEYFK